MGRLLWTVVALMMCCPGTTVAADSVVFTFKITGQPDQTFAVDMPAGSLQQAVVAFATIYPRPETVIDKDGKSIPNPVTPPRWMAQKIREFCIEVTRAHSLKVATQAAAAATNAQLNALEKTITVRDESPTP